MSSYGKIDSFDEHNESWNQYHEKLEQYYFANDITNDEKKRAIFLTTVGNRTFSVLRSLCSPSRITEVDYSALIEHMNRHYNPRTSEIVERFRFNCRNRYDNESIAIFVAQLRRLAENCNFGSTLETMLRDRLVCGIRDSLIQKRLLAEPELTLAKAVDIATAMETAVKHSTDLQHETTSYPQQVNHANARYNQMHANTVDRTKSKTTTMQRQHDHKKDKRQGFRPQQCYRCGSTRHTSGDCPCTQVKCNSCKKTGHLAKMCITSGNFRPKLQHQEKTIKKKPEKSVHTMSAPYGDAQTNEYDMINDNELAEYFEVFQLSKQIEATKPWLATFTIDKSDIVMEIDTGAPHTLIAKHWFDEHVAVLPKLKPHSIKLKSYTGESVDILGMITIDVTFGNNCKKLSALVVNNATVNLCGRDWISSFEILKFSPELNIHNATRVEDNATNIDARLAIVLDKHKQVFEDKLGTLKDTKVHLQRKDKVEPKFFKARSVPYAYKEKVAKELDRLVQEGIITAVKSSAWAAPIVPVLKKDKESVRICGDFKLTANKATVTEQYPLPRVEDLYANLAGGTKFTKLDLRDAYNQLEVNDALSELLVINTEKGLFKYKRLPFGVSSASSAFQREMENLMKDAPGTSSFQDDLLVTGRNDDDHLDNLDRALQVIEDAGLKLRLKKCCFMEDSVEYLGHCLDKNGIHPTKEKVEVITIAPRPKYVEEHRSFLGLITYYSKFIKDMSTTLAPLNKLLAKNTR